MLFPRIVAIDAKAQMDRIPSVRVFVGGSIVALLVLSGLCVAVSRSSATAAVPRVDDVVGRVTVTPESNTPAGMTCTECGMIESVRLMPREQESDPHTANLLNRDGLAGPTVAAVQMSEITVRMNDGTSHQFVDANRSKWHPGERMIFIEGMKTSRR